MFISNNLFLHYLLVNYISLKENIDFFLSEELFLITNQGWATIFNYLFILFLVISFVKKNIK